MFSWPESGNVSRQDVNVSAWAAGDYSAPGPDANEWLSRCDPRITAAWVGSGVIGFGWSANRKAGRPYPYVRIVRLDEKSKAVVDEPDIWSNNYAYAYPDACPNDRGHVGITLFRGGGNRHPGHIVGILDDCSPGWSLRATRDGTHGPADAKWGDYLTCRRHSPDGLTWIAAGFTLRGGASRDFIEPRVTHFGRRRDQPAVDRWQGA